NIKVCYKNKSKCDDIEPIVDGNVNTDEMGEYNISYKYTYKDQELVLNQVVEVDDISGPRIINASDALVKVCPNGKVIDKDAISIVDNVDGVIKEYESEINGTTLIIKAKDSKGNTSSSSIPAEVGDKTKPTIKISGSKSMSLTPGSKYTEQGAIVTDNCDDNLKVETSGSVDTSKIGTYEITYTTKDSSGNSASAKRTVTVREKQAGEKVIYLTFDDGPGAYTEQLLDVLKKYNVKATFFVTGKGEDSVIKREYDEGHTVGLHTYSHDYKQVYASQTAYFEDLYKIRDRVKRITGYESNIIRFPGGTSNTVSKISMKALAKEVVNRGFYYFDWNVSSGDAGGTTTADGVYNNTINTLKSGTSVVLQHDIKKYSVDAVERIIKYGLENGYTFERLTEDSPKIRHGANK
nr:polysaccharide deacetylase family protein [Bacilli bacterium]